MLLKHIFESVKNPTLQQSLTLLLRALYVCCFARCTGILAVADFAAARAKASRSGELETLCGNDEELDDLDFGSVPELEVDFGFFKELHGAAVEVVAVSGSAKLPFDGLAFLSSSELDSTTRLRRPG